VQHALLAVLERERLPQLDQRAARARRGALLAHPAGLGRGDQRRVAGAGQERGLLVGGRLAPRAHDHPAGRLLRRVAEAARQRRAGAHRRDPGGDGRLDHAALGPRVAAAGQMLVHEHTFEPQPFVQLHRQDVGDGALIVGRSQRGQKLAREPKRGDRHVAHHRTRLALAAKCEEIPACAHR
jgi:hypothetical protein